MKKYVVGNIYAPDCRILDVYIDADLSNGLMEKLAKVQGVTGVYEDSRLSDTVFSIHISRRADEEDIRIIRIELDKLCNDHTTT